MQKTNLALIIIQLTENGESYSISYTGNVFFEFEEIDELIRFDKRKLMVYKYWIHVSGNNVFTRLVNFNSDYRNEVVFDKNDSYRFCTKDFENKRIITFWRDNIGIRILDKLKIQNKHIFGMSGGIIPILDIKDLYRNELLDFNVVIEENNIIQLNRNIEFKSLDKESKKMIYNSICDHLHDKNVFNQCFSVDEYFFTKNEYRNHKIFNSIGVVFLTFLFFVLVLNNVYFKHLAQEINSINESMEIEMNNFSTIQQLNEERNRKLSLLNSNGNLTSNYLTFYIDRLVACKSKGITLSELEVLPLQEVNKNNGTIKFQENLIYLKGETLDCESLNKWIEKINSFDWISDSEITKIDINDFGNYNFTIKINLK